MRAHSETYVTAEGLTGSATDILLESLTTPPSFLMLSTNVSMSALFLPNFIPLPAGLKHCRDHKFYTAEEFKELHNIVVCD